MRPAVAGPEPAVETAEGDRWRERRRRRWRGGGWTPRDIIAGNRYKSVSDHVQAMSIQIAMPQLSDTMESGTIIKWHVKEGDHLSAGDVVADVETDKATMEMQVFDDGTLARILVGDGQSASVGMPIAVLAERDEDPSDVALRAIETSVELPADVATAARLAEAMEEDRTAFLEVLALVNEIVQEYAHVLRAKRRQKTYTDEYGVLIDRAWQAEVSYFLDKVVRPELLTERYVNAVGKALRHVAADRPAVACHGEQRKWLDEDLCDYIDTIVKEQDVDSVVAKEFKEGMSPTEYERYCGDLLKAAGWEVRVCGGSGDQGVDLVAERDGLIVVLQCKMHSKSVGNSAVQEVYTGMKFHSAHRAVVVSSADFTPGARSAAQQTGVLLLHHSALADLHTTFTNSGS